MSANAELFLAAVVLAVIAYGLGFAWGVLP